MAVLAICFASPVGAEVPTRILVLSDARGYEGFAHVFKLANAAVGGQVSFVLSPGDMTPLPKTRRVLDDVFGASVPWYPVIGNHEVADKPSMAYLYNFYRDHLKGKAKPGPAGAEETTYSFDAGPVHVVAINEYWNGKIGPGSDTRADGDVVPALLRWVSSDLAKSDKPWKLVVGHEPAFPQEDRDWKHGTRHAGDSLDRHPDHRNAFWRMLRDRGATAYLCGHTHRYSRVQPEVGSVWQIDAVQARGDQTWKYDAFILISGDATSLTFETYRNLRERGKFEVTDHLSFSTADRKD